MSRLIYILLVIFCGKQVLSQKNNLKMKDAIENIVLNNNYNKVENIEIGQKKIQIIYFWSPEVKASHEFLSTLKQLKQSSENLKLKDSCSIEITAIATQCDYLDWLVKIDSLELTGIRNLIIKKFYSDSFWPKFNIKNVPLILVVNTYGIIDLVNPSLETINNYLDARKYTSSSLCISGKIIETENKKPYSNKKIAFINNNSDTLSMTTTDKNGVFEIQFLKNQLNYTLNLEPNLKSKSSYKLLNNKGVYICKLNSKQNNVNSKVIKSLIKKPNPNYSNNLIRQSITIK